MNIYLSAPISVEIPVEAPGSHIVKLSGLRRIFQTCMESLKHRENPHI